MPLPEVAMDVARWREDPVVREVLLTLADYRPILETAIRIQQVPAPTFQEAERAALVRRLFLDLGLSQVEVDQFSNVYARRPGRTAGPALLISAHLDTVFPAETSLDVRYEGDRIYGAGLGDNSVGVAGLIHLAQAFQAHNLPNEVDLWFVANVCEEGLGDLRGMRAVVDRLQQSVGAAVVIEGCDFGTIHHQAIGVRRYRVEACAPGGHSWGDFGKPSAIHALVRLAARLSKLPAPASPRTTFNIGVIEGGTSVNTIAQNASMLLDMRSVDVTALERFVAQVDLLITEAQAAEQGIRLVVTRVGDRPAGAIARTHPLVQAAAAAYRTFGAQVTFQQGSTDANIPLSRSMPAICVGLTDGGNAHRSDEYIVPASLGHGVQALLLLAVAAANSRM